MPFVICIRTCLKCKSVENKFSLDLDTILLKLCIYYMFNDSSAFYENLKAFEVLRLHALTIIIEKK